MVFQWNVAPNNLNKDSGNDFVFGAGATYTLNEKIKIRAEWERFFLKHDIDLYSSSVIYGF